MTISVFDAAKYLCKRSKWRYTHLELQKLIYLGHMVHIGEQGTPLVHGYFEAWKYGPVHPELYHHLKGWGTRQITEDAIAFVLAKDLDRNSTERAVLKEVSKEFPPSSGRELVAVTHWDNSAWSQVYKPDEFNVLISNDAIREEYKKRTAA